MFLGLRRSHSILLIRLHVLVPIGRPGESVSRYQPPLLNSCPAPDPRRGRPSHYMDPATMWCKEVGSSTRRISLYSILTPGANPHRYPRPHFRHSICRRPIVSPTGSPQVTRRDAFLQLKSWQTDNSHTIYRCA
ncbi:hypothetical protein F5Y15DRAFT_365177 [Xylariaceae sp. FL0016]|nr:hypothetical protein F5Y15DRAFT_365177 [Xylariaceae sp. FL0016]